MIKQLTIFSMIIVATTATHHTCGMWRKLNSQRYSQLQPGAFLKSPNKLLAELKSYQEKDDQYEWTARYSNPEGYQEHRLYGKQLLDNALITHCFLSYINKSNRNHEEQVIHFNRFMDSWKDSDDVSKQRPHKEY